MGKLIEFFLYCLVLFGLFFSLLASQGCASEDNAWRPRDYCAAVRDDWCSEHCNRDTALCQTRVYRACQEQVEGLVPHDDATECLGDIAEQACIYTSLPASCPQWP